MKKDLVHSLTQNFEAHANHTEGGIEFWLARDLQYLLGYSKWDNFLNVVSKAKTACEVSGHVVPDHFADVGKMVDLGSGSQREVDDIMLTRYACYLVAQNGDPCKQEIAFDDVSDVPAPAKCPWHVFAARWLRPIVVIQDGSLTIT